MDRSAHEAHERAYGTDDGRASPHDAGSRHGEEVNARVRLAVRNCEPAARPLRGVDMKPLNPLKFGIAMAIPLAGLNAACALALVVAPDATISVFNSFMHGVDLSRLVPPGGRPVTVTQVLGGMFAIGAV